METKKEISDNEAQKQMRMTERRVREVPFELLEKAKLILWEYTANKPIDRDLVKNTHIDLCTEMDKVSDAYKIDHMKRKFGGNWKEHPDYPLETWRERVFDGSCRRGYWEWVLNEIEVEGKEYDFREFII